MYINHSIGWEFASCAGPFGHIPLLDFMVTRLDNYGGDKLRYRETLGGCHPLNGNSGSVSNLTGSMA